MSIFEKIKGLCDYAKRGMTVDLREYIVSLREKVVEQQEQIMELKEKNSELQAKIDACTKDLSVKDQ